MTSLDSFKCRKTLKVGTKSYIYYSLPTAEKNGLKGISRLPYSMKVLLENLLRNEDDRTVKIDMTLTAPGCPVAGEMPGWVENAVGTVEGVSGVEVKMVFDPPWTPDRMSEEAQVAVGWY